MMNDYRHHGFKTVVFLAHTLCICESSHGLDLAELSYKQNTGQESPLPSKEEPLFGLPPGRGQPSPAVGWIRNALLHANLNIGNVTVINNTLNITDFICGDISIGVTNTSYTPPLDIDFTLNNISSSCHGAYTLFGKIFKETHTGHLDVNVSVQSVAVHVQLYRGNHSLIWGAGVTDCEANIALSLSFGTHEGWLTKDILDLFDKSLQSTIQKSLCQGLSNWANHSLGQGISNISQALEPWILMVEPAAEPPLPANISYISLFNNPVVMFLNYMASSYIGADGTCGVDKLVNFFLPGADLAGVAIDNVNVTVPVNQNGTVTATLGLTDYNISGFASFEDFSLFEAMSAHELSTDITLEKLNVKIGGFVELNGLQSDGTNATAPVQWFTLTADLDNSHFVKWTEIRVDSKKMHALHGTQSGDVDCLDSTTDMVKTTYLDLNMTLKDFVLDLQGGNVDADFDALLSGILKLVTMSLEPVLPKAVRGVLAGPGRDKLNAAMVELLQNATCAPVADDKSTALAEIAGATGGVIVLVVLLLWCCGRTAKSARITGLEGTRGLVDGQNDEDEDAYDDALLTPWANDDNAVATSSEGGAMLLSPHVPFVLKCGIAVGIVGTMGLFLCGVVARGAEVIPTVSTNHTVDVTLPPLYYLSLLGSIRDSYHAKAFAVSYFIGASNMVWPVLRTVLLLYAVLAPGGLTLKWCNRITLVCDIMGKWVLAQNFVATLMMIAFRYAAIFHGTDEHGEPIQGSVHMFVLFDWWGWWGIVTCFLTGFATTQCIFMGIHYMRAGSENAEDGGIATSMKTTWERFEDVDTYSSAGKLESVCSSRARPVEPIMFVVLAVGTLGFFIYAIIAPAFTFVNYGLTRMFQDASGVAGSREYSIWQLIQLMPDPHFVHHTANMHFLQAIVVLVAIVAPMLQVVLALVLYFVPMTRVGVEKVVWGIEAVSAWASMDVMVVAIVAGFMQIGLFAQFIVGNKCAALIGLLHNPKMDPLLHHDDKCLDAKAIIHMGTIFLGIVAVLCHAVAAYAVEVSRRRGPPVKANSSEDATLFSIPADDSDTPTGAIN